MEANKGMNIYQRINEITNALKTVKKNLEVKAGGGTYKAVAEADVLKAVRPLEYQYGVCSFPFCRTVLNSDTVDVKKDGGVKTNFFLRIETTYRFVNVDKPDEYLDVTTYGDGLDSSDKGPGKAMTYADKYALLKCYKIATGDDPDGEASGEVVNPKATGGQPCSRPRTQQASKTTCKSKYSTLSDLLKTVGGWDLNKVKEWIISKTGKDLRVNDLSDALFEELVRTITAPAEGGSNE